MDRDKSVKMVDESSYKKIPSGVTIISSGKNDKDSKSLTDIEKGVSILEKLANIFTTIFNLFNKQKK